MNSWTFGGYELRTPEEKAQDEKAEADKELEAILNYMDYENPVKCPLCGSGNIDVRYVEEVDWAGYWHTGDMFKCPDCGAESEYE